MQELENPKFYLLSDYGCVFDVSQAEQQISYGESFQGIQSYCEPGDWIMTVGGEIIKNIGQMSITRWAEESHNFCIPANEAANDFLESLSEGSSYYSFVSVYSGESVLARYLFQQKQWEIVFPEIAEEENSEIQILDLETFVVSFQPEDMEAQKYVEYFQLLPKDKNGVILSCVPNLISKKETSDEWTIEGRFPCDCYSHEMSFFADSEDKFAEFGYWQRGRGEQPWSWKTRFKMVWDILTTGNPYSDMIILNRHNAEKLRDTLNNFLDKTK